MDGPGTRRPDTRTGPAVPPATGTILPLLLITLSLVVPVAPATAADGDQSLAGNLLAPHGLTANGHLRTTADQATLDLRGYHVAPSVALTADRLEINYSWERGVDATPPGHPVILSHVTESGSRTLVFENATVDLSKGVDDTAQVVALADLPTARFSTTAVSNDLGLVEDLRVAGAGSSEDNTRASGSTPVGFHRDLAGPHVALEGNTWATVTGTFEVFVNNLTLSVAHEDGTWEAWAGYRDENATPSDPTGTDAVPAPMRTYERHVITLEVYRGQLTSDALVASGLYASRIVTDLHGGLHTSVAYGSLATASRALTLDGDLLTLRGTGTLDASITTPGAVAGPVPPGDRPVLNVTTEGTFEVLSGQALTPAGETGDDGGVLAALPSVPWPLLPVALLLVLGAVVAVPWLYPRAQAAYHRWRCKLFDQRYEHARDLYNQGNFPGARKTLRRAARWVPDDGEELFSLARAQSMSDDPEAALATLDRAKERGVWMPRIKELELRVMCYTAVDQDDQALGALIDLERVDHELAVDLVLDLALWDLAEQVEGLKDLATDDPEPTGGFDGYV